MPLSPAAKHWIDRAALILTATAVVILMATIAEKSAGKLAGPVWMTRVICFGFVLARVIPWLKRQHATNPNAVAGIAGLVAFIGMMFALTNDGVETMARFVGRAVLLFGVPAFVVWKLDPEGCRQAWQDGRAQHSPKQDALTTTIQPRTDLPDAGHTPL